MKKLMAILLFLAFSLNGYGYSSQKNVPYINSFFKNKIHSKVPGTTSEYSGFQILLGLGKAYNVLNEFELAISFLLRAEKSATKEWQFMAVYTELTESYFSLGNKEKAIEYYNKTLSHKGTETDVEKRERLSVLMGLNPLFKNWKTLETKHIRFHFQDISMIENVQAYTDEREKAYGKIHRFFLSELPKKIDFFIWKSEKKASEILGKSIDFSAPRYCVAHTKIGTTKGHEIAHNIAFWSERSINITPLIYEGIGVYFDQIDLDKMLLAKSAIQNQRINVKQLWLNPKDYSKEILEAVAGAFVEKLIQFDKKKFLELCRNQSYQNAEYIYETELRNIITEFNRDLNKR